MSHHKLILSDVYSGLFHLDDESIDIAITSPPYWNQRDYGIDDQIGNESTPDLYIRKLDEIFRLLKKKMRRDGVFFLNIGDKYLLKYGKSPLGFIPYRLADEMIKSRWCLSDIFIWYKPNHMPSSIKNKFTNSYEPIFVFSPSQKNIFTKYVDRTKNYTNVLNINLQPTPYKHVAVYPEKLVETLIQMVDLRENANILDPFAGSGTTLKAIQNLNKNANGIMIEKNIDYLKIIKDRCSLNGNFDELKYEDISFNHQNADEENVQLEIFKDKFSSFVNPDLKRGFVKVFKSRNDYYKLLSKFINHSLKLKYRLDGIFFIGSKQFDLDLILDTASLNKRGWIIKNMIIVKDDLRWFPLFFVVDGNKKYDYKFDYEKLNLKSKSSYQRNWHQTEFRGLKIVDSVNKNKRAGIVIDIIERYEDGFPKFIIAKWDDEMITKEYVILDQKIVDRNISIKKLQSDYLIIEKDELTSLDNTYKYKTKALPQMDILSNGGKINTYNGKFLSEKRINWGASPGARASVEEEYFSLQRFYSVDQKIVSDYLNLKRINKNITKSELTNQFPPNYRHTVGHWLRNDFGGSIPTPTDWLELCKILDIDKIFTNYVCKTALRLQTVRHSEFKPPKDFIEKSFINRLKLLYSD